MSNKILITSMGWEPRFLSGVDDILSTYRPDKVLVFNPSTFFTEITVENKIVLSQSLDVLNVQYEYFEFRSDNHVEVWNVALNVLGNLTGDSEIVLDITTMPRYLIWACLHSLESVKVKFRCVYYPPESYGEWLSAETGKPQMVFRHSGIAYPDLPTALILFSGFDVSRAQNFVDFFEPKKVLLVTQQGTQLDNSERCISQLSGGAEIDLIKLDAYSDPVKLKNEIREAVSKDIDSYNFIATSVGPRPSIIALYLLNREESSVGLVHANAHQYNQNYSYGVNVAAKYESFIDFSVS
ncbi:hypothetical protein [Pseudomonas protegens]|uniref:hypothetical protein n=1 Tax=Pseudomonas protegens TaxID=380021 RepID=UPI0011B7C44B|nr:hypothetical protein [Pseudomonas protegens]